LDVTLSFVLTLLAIVSTYQNLSVMISTSTKAAYYYNWTFCMLGCIFWTHLLCWDVPLCL